MVREMEVAGIAICQFLADFSRFMTNYYSSGPQCGPQLLRLERFPLILAHVHTSCLRWRIRRV